MLGYIILLLHSTKVKGVVMFQIRLRDIYKYSMLVSLHKTGGKSFSESLYNSPWGELHTKLACEAAILFYSILYVNYSINL